MIYDIISLESLNQSKTEIFCMNVPQCSYCKLDSGKNVEDVPLCR